MCGAVVDLGKGAHNGRQCGGVDIGRNAGEGGHRVIGRICTRQVQIGDKHGHCQACIGCCKNRCGCTGYGDLIAAQWCDHSIASQGGGGGAVIRFAIGRQAADHQCGGRDVAGDARGLDQVVVGLVQSGNGVLYGD